MLRIGYNLFTLKGHGWTGFFDFFFINRSVIGPFFHTTYRAVPILTSNQTIPLSCNLIWCNGTFERDNGNEPVFSFFFA